ncbi:MAG TPA: rRNA maturation RNase YbeY [Bacteroidia bacterium]|jgi:probable rRNA maturation factor|nr:rRNA maturation RNase YbeY [Bacteroidia bacterium]
MTDYIISFTFGLMAITFSFSQKIKTPPKKALKGWAEKIALSEKRKIKTLAYTFCSDEELWQMNKQYLSHDTYTDIITFDYSEESAISGEIYISVQRVIENAEKLKITFQEELLRVMAHGILHLCGYKDKNPIQQKQMRRAEERALKLFKGLPKA